jgi:FlaA1/EpsC-like NDP-sugar epimerase
VTLDAGAVAAAWVASRLIAPGTDDRGLTEPSVLLGVAAVTIVALLFATSQHLYLARVSSVRAYEVAGLGRVALVSAVVAYLVGTLQVEHLSAVHFLVGGAIAFVLLTTLRGWFGRWLRAHRLRGGLTRSMVVVGSGGDAANLVALLLPAPRPLLRRELVGRTRPRRAPGHRAGRAGSGVASGPSRPTPRIDSVLMDPPVEPFVAQEVGQ